MRSWSRAASLGAAALLPLLSGAPSLAQPVAPVHVGIRPLPQPAVVVNRPQARPPQTSLGGHLGPAVADRLLASDSEEERLRGIERLASVADPAAIDRLLRLLDPGNPTGKDPRARLIGVRALAPFAARDDVRQALSKALTGDLGATSLGAMVRDTSALALAASGDPKGLELLASALKQGGAPGESARRALLAHPPSLALPSSAAREGLSPATCELLGALGDLRALEPLRATLARIRPPAAGSDGGAAPGSPDESSIAAAIALARLGDEEPVPVARAWAGSDDPRLRAAAAEILVASGAPDAPAAIARLIAAPASRDAGLKLALAAPSPALAPALAALLADVDGGARTSAIAALGRSGGPEASRALGALLGDEARGWDAAFALALSAGSEPRAALGRALAAAPSRRLAARASVLREALLHDGPGELPRALSAMLASSEPADRAVAAFGLVALGRTRMRTMLATRDLVIVRAAARAVLVAPDDDAPRACAARLAGESDETTRAALAVSFAVSPADAESVPTSTLVAWADAGGAIAPLAARLLGSREDAALRERIARLLASGDPVIRAHAALGLGDSPEPDAASRLGSAYRFETDAAVRRAVARALARRAEPQRRTTLELAARLDPDLEVRELARLALASPVAAERAASVRPPRPGYAAWVRVAPNGPEAAEEVAGRPARLVRADGLALPVVTDPDGGLLTLGLPPGSASLDLAFRPPADDARAP